MILYCWHLLNQKCAGSFKFVMCMLNAKKSKCPAVAPKSRRGLLLNGSICLFVGGLPIDFVQIHSHTFAHVIGSKLDDSDDIMQRRRSFTGQTSNVLCDFWNVDFNVRYKLLRSY